MHRRARLHCWSICALLVGYLAACAGTASAPAPQPDAGQPADAALPPADAQVPVARADVALDAPEPVSADVAGEIAQVAVDAGPAGPDGAIATSGASPAVWQGGFVDASPLVPGGLAVAIGKPFAPSADMAPYPNYTAGMLADVTGDGVVDIVHFSQGGAARIATGFGTAAAESVTLQVDTGLDPRLNAVTVLDRAGADSPYVVFGASRIAAFRRKVAQDGTVSWPDEGDGFGMPATSDHQRQHLLPADVDNDGLVDLVVAAYHCSPKPAPVVYLNRGDGTFHDHAADLGLDAVGAQWGALVADLDQDGDLDGVWMHDGCGDVTTTQVFVRNLGRGPDGWPELVREAPHPFWQFPVPVMPYTSPMAAAAGDVDGDGRLDLVLANVGMPMAIEAALKVMVGMDMQEWVARLVQNNLLVGQADLTFVDEGLERGLKSLVDGVKGLDMTAWSVAMLDFDRDGWLDIALANGPDYDAFANKNRGPMRPVLLRNLGNGHFAEVSAQAGLPAVYEGMGLSAGDVDGDGDDDLLLGGLGAQPMLLRNDVQTPHHFLRLRLRGTTSNPRGLGALVEVEAGGVTQRRAVGAASPITTWHEPVADFGLGGALAAHVVVRWPSGYVQQLGQVAADQVLTVQEPALLQVSERVLTPGKTVTVTAQPHGPDGLPQPGPVTVDLVPPGVLHWQQPLQCPPTGPCKGVLAVAQQPSGPATVFVRATLAGQTLATWPRLTVLPGQP